jgi:hypothetical protein
LAQILIALQSKQKVLNFRKIHTPRFLGCYTCRRSMSHRDDVKVVGRAVVLVLLSKSQEFLVVHDPEICSLDGLLASRASGTPCLRS